MGVGPDDEDAPLLDPAPIGVVGVEGIVPRGVAEGAHLTEVPQDLARPQPQVCCRGAKGGVPLGIEEDQPRVGIDHHAAPSSHLYGVVAAERLLVVAGGDLHPPILSRPRATYVVLPHQRLHDLVPVARRHVIYLYGEVECQSLAERLQPVHLLVTRAALLRVVGGLDGEVFPDAHPCSPVAVKGVVPAAALLEGLLSQPREVGDEVVDVALLLDAAQLGVKECGRDLHAPDVVDAGMGVAEADAPAVEEEVRALVLLVIEAPRYHAEEVIPRDEGQRLSLTLCRRGVPQHHVGEECTLEL